MKTWHWVLLIFLLVGVALAIGYYLSTLKKAYDNKDKIEGGLQILSGLEKLDIL